MQFLVNIKGDEPRRVKVEVGDEIVASILKEYIETIGMLEPERMAQSDKAYLCMTEMVFDIFENFVVTDV